MAESLLDATHCSRDQLHSAKLSNGYLWLGAAGVAVACAASVSIATYNPEKHVYIDVTSNPQLCLRGDLGYKGRG